MLDLESKKSDYDAIITDITTPDYNEFTSNIFDAKIKQKNQSIYLIFLILQKILT